MKLSKLSAVVAASVAAVVAAPASADVDFSGDR